MIHSNPSDVNVGEDEEDGKVDEGDADSDQTVPMEGNEDHPIAVDDDNNQEKEKETGNDEETM